jgi:hypothetical protein
MYPNKYFNYKQWAIDEDSWYGRSVYQYGTGTRSIAMIRTPAAAAFSAAPPYDFFEIGIPRWRFTYRPDVAAGPPTIVGRNVEINIQALTAVQIASATVSAIAEVSVAQNIDFSGAKLNYAAQSHPNPIDNQLTITHLATGVRGVIDFTGITAVAGFVFTAFSPAAGGGMAIGSVQPYGFIVCVGGALLVDTETVIIESPISPTTTLTVTFEFNSGGGVTAGNTAVPFTGGDSAATVAATFAGVINNPAVNPTGRGPLWGTLARNVPGSPLVELYSTKGSLGGSIFSGQMLVETVANAGFIVAGITGGQDGSINIPLRWGLSRGMVPNPSFGFDEERGEG